MSSTDESERKKGQRGRLKRSKARNLLERLLKYEEDVLRFMVEGFDMDLWLRPELCG